MALCGAGTLSHTGRKRDEVATKQSKCIWSHKSMNLQSSAVYFCSPSLQKTPDLLGMSSASLFKDLVQGVQEASSSNNSSMRHSIRTNKNLIKASHSYEVWDAVYHLNFAFWSKGSPLKKPRKGNTLTRSICFSLGRQTRKSLGLHRAKINLHNITYNVVLFIP